MAGHSKWANIKRRKGIQDQKRGKAFSKLSKAITVAAKRGGDPTINLALKYAIDKAKAGNMPNATIDTAVKKGTGELVGDVLDELTYEGFVGSVAVLVEALSDKRSRTTPEIKKIFDSRGGALGGSNSVAFMFDHKGMIAVKADGVDPDRLMEVGLDCGAEDISEEPEEGSYMIKTANKDLHAVQTALEAAGFVVESGDLVWLPQSTVAPVGAEREKAENLINALEDHDDVQNVYTNLGDPET
jgi:YebC/PmpR family DNA-binding regulatory protein